MEDILTTLMYFGAIIAIALIIFPGAVQKV
jgi:hypothetical protein